MGTNETLSIKLDLRGEKAAQAGLEATRRKVRGLGHQTDRTSASMSRANRRSAAFSGGLRKVGRAARLGGFALGAGLVYGLKKSVDGFKESQVVAAQTAAGIKSTGGAANVTAKQVAELSGALQKQSGLSDELVGRGANLLLTFTKVRNEVGKGNKIFNQATQAALDLSVKGYGSMDSTSKMLGKALNDPVRGITAMSRAGVTFTDQQKKQIKTMAESGNMLGAQKKILAEVNKQVGGAAAAYGKTFEGSVSRAKETLGDFGEIVGGKIAPYLTRAADALAGFSQGMIDGTGAGGKVVRVFKNFGRGLRDLFYAFKPAKGEASELSGVLRRLGVFVVTASEKFRDFGAWMREGGTGAQRLKKGLRLVWVTATMTTRISIIAGKTLYGAFQKGAQGVQWLRGKWDALLERFGGPASTAFNAVLAGFGRIKTGFGKMIDWVSGKWDAFAGKLNTGLGALDKITPGGMPRLPTTGGGGGGSLPAPTPQRQEALGETFGSPLRPRSRSGGLAARWAGATAAAGGGGDTVVNIDGREVFRATKNHGARLAARA